MNIYIVVEIKKRVFVKIIAWIRGGNKRSSSLFRKYISVVR